MQPRLSGKHGLLSGFNVAEYAMDLPKIKTLIDFVGRKNVNELTVTQKNVTVRIFRSVGDVAVTTSTLNGEAVAPLADSVEPAAASNDASAVQVRAPIFGVLHRASAPGQPPFVNVGDVVEEGQTLFIIEAMKVFNKIPAPRAGRIAHLTEIDGGEVETNDLLAEIA